MVEDDGSTHAVIFINSNAQEFETFPLPGLIYRTIVTLNTMFSKNLSSFASYIIQKSKLKEQISDFYYVLCTHNVSAGGLLDLIVLLGPSPEDVTKQASAALGRCFSMKEGGNKYL